jgi:hypothetical protein
MKKIIITLLISAATLGFASGVIAATNEAKATYKAAKESAGADYKVAREACNALAGNPKDVCVAEAESVAKHTKADAEAKYKNTVSARTSARISMANADYDVAKAKCGSKNGNEKDVCIKEAKAVLVTAKADANAHEKVVDARVEARDEKVEAAYKVAIEKCDALSGSAKDTCVASAKTQFKK